MRVLNPTSLTTTQAVEGLGAYALYHLASLDEHMFKQWPYVNHARPRARIRVLCLVYRLWACLPWACLPPLGLSTALGLVYRPWACLPPLGADIPSTAGCGQPMA